MISSLGCTPQFAHVPNDVIEPEVFTELIVDIRLAEAQEKVYRQKGIYNKELLDSSYQMIYALRGVTPSEFERSYNWYLNHPNWMEKLSAEAIEKLNRMEK